MQDLLTITGNNIHAKVAERANKKRRWQAKHHPLEMNKS